MIMPYLKYGIDISLVVMIEKSVNHVLNNFAQTLHAYLQNAGTSRLSNPVLSQLRKMLNSNKG